MIKITFPDGSVREYAEGTTAYQIAESISPRLAADSLAAAVNGATVDMTRPIETDASVKFYKWDDDEGKHAFWHTSSHLLAEALEALYPGIKFGIGPAIENGFYYDVDSPTPITEADLPTIENKMVELSRNKEALLRREVPKAEALKTFTEKGDQYKVELISDLQDGTISFYTNGAFTDLCRGPHIPNTGYIKALKLTSVAGAYWRGNEKNKMLTRIYGISFPKKSMLDEYLALMEEAKKRDHRKLGKELGLFMLRDEGPGFPFFLPKGMVLKNTLIDYWREVHKRYGYVEISTPMILNRRLWERSGHWDHYKQNMYTTVIDGEDFAIKPMNCPGGMLVYKSQPHSYRDLPMRLGETSTLFRNEDSGEMHGLIRVRQFTISEGHLVLRPDQLEEEFKGCLDLAKYCLGTVGLLDKCTFRFSQWDPANPNNKYEGTKEQWDHAQSVMERILKDLDVDYTVGIDEAAFYGPKLDIQYKNVYGKEDTLVTIQIDMLLAERFGMYYIDENGEKKLPYIIHRTSLGCYERTLAYLIEEYAGALPTWMAPEQVRFLPVTDRAADYCAEQAKKLEDMGFRVEVDYRNEKIGRKIRDAQMEKVPYMVVVGDRDMENGTVSPRHRTDGDLGAMSMDEFSALLKQVVDNKEKK